MKFEDDGPWELEVVGFEVLGLALGAYLVDVIAYGPEGEMAKIRLSGPFDLHHPDGHEEGLDPKSWKILAALACLRKAKIRLASITNTSELRVDFESGLAIASPSSAEYENWEMHAPGGVLVIAMPGGEPPAIWDGDLKRTVTHRDGRHFDSDGNEIPDYLKRFFGRSETQA